LTKAIAPSLTSTPMPSPLIKLIVALIRYLPMVGFA
jgi:hypothetical protein